MTQSSMTVVPMSSESVINASVMRRLADAGYPVLIEDDAAVLRAAFAHTQRLYAAILDPRDYLYLVSYKEDKKTRQFVSKNRGDADKFAQTYKSEVVAKPVKTGIVKLAVALGIEAHPETKGWCKDELGQFYYEVTYRATHQRSGRTEYGVGACDRSERGGHIRTHDIITTADTRAYNRAILRLSGFGDVSADEVIAATEDDLPEYIPEPSVAQPFKELPPIGSDDVLVAARTWAEMIAARTAGPDRYAGAARQDSFSTRETRAAARRGDAAAARRLGALGMQWEGEAQDGQGHPSFTVETSPVTPKEVEAVIEASVAQEPAKAPNNGEGGWNLSSKGSPGDDLPGEPSPGKGIFDDLNTSSPVPPPDLRCETITTKEAKNVSGLLLGASGGDRDKARAWLKDNGHVDKSTELRSNQYGPIMNTLNALQKATKKEN